MLVEKRYEQSSYYLCITLFMQGCKIKYDSVGCLYIKDSLYIKDDNKDGIFSNVLIRLI